MPSSESRTHRRGVFWVAVPVLCLASAVVGGAVVRGWNAPRLTASSAAVSGAAAGNVAHPGDDLGALRAEVGRLNLLVGAMAAQGPSAAPPPAEAPKPPAPSALLSEGAMVTKEDVIARYEAAPPNAKKTRTVASSLDELVKKESLAASRIKVDEVDCRGESCRVRVSFAEDAPASPIVMELAALLPDSHSFQEAAPAGDNRRAVTSHYIDEASTARR